MVEDLFDEWQQAAKAAKERSGRFGCHGHCSGEIITTSLRPKPGIMINKGNHPQDSRKIQVSEILFHLPSDGLVRSTCPVRAHEKLILMFLDCACRLVGYHPENCCCYTYIE